MAKIYIYLVFYLLGFASAMILVWYTKKPQNELHVNKIKQKNGNGNVLDADLHLDVKPEKSKKELRQEKRADRRADRKLKEEAEKLKTVITNLNQSK